MSRHAAFVLALPLFACAPGVDGVPVADEALDTAMASNGNGSGDANGNGNGNGNGGNNGGLADPTDVDALYKSGSRIKRRVLEGGDGSEAFLGFWDDDLGTACAWADDGEGTMRCMPTSYAYVYPGEEARYADAQCTQPLAQVSRGSCGFGDAPTVAIDDGRCSARGYHELGARHTGTVYVQFEGCRSVSNDPSVRWYRVVGDLAITDFQSGTVATR